MAFVKLDTKILDSTLWIERDCREMFITALLLAHPYELVEPTPQIEVRTLALTGFMVPVGWYGFVPAAGVGIARRAMVDQEIGMIALERLGSPDPESRSPEFDGRRLVRVDGGYIVLNFIKYREKDTTAAERSKRWRDRKKINNSTHRDATELHRDDNGDTPESRVIRHQAEDRRQKTEALPTICPADAGPIVSSEKDLPTNSTTNSKNANRELRENAKEILGYLNRSAGKGFHEVDANLDQIIARLKEGASVLQAKEVVFAQVAAWSNDPDWEKYLRPETLFRRSKFWSYLGNITAPPPEKISLDPESQRGVESTSTGGDDDIPKLDD